MISIQPDRPDGLAQCNMALQAHPLGNVRIAGARLRC
jgi:hypothetical protein